MDAVEEVKSRLNIEDVIGEYVQLKRAGRNWRGLSPFTSERTPSFMVSPEKQIWHDFSSGKGGNIFSFVMEMEGLEFRQTLELLARRAGVDLEQFDTRKSSNNTKLKDRLYQALELATKFYQVQFSKNHQALEYILKQRGFSKDTALKWQIGYSPNNGSALIDFLKTKGFSEDEIRRAGLSSRTYRGLNDMFRGRIMIPLADSQGKVVGFTARQLIDQPNSPKYINTPSTILYDKSRQVFGLHLAKEAIRKNKYVVLVEGNLDVIASHQAGISQVVATAGTALTEQHLKALSRLAGDVRLCFDADQAGINATERAIPLASRTGVTLSIISIPSGKDPDELIKQKPEAWQQAIEKPKEALDWLIDHFAKQLDLSTATGKKKFSDLTMTIIGNLPDKVEQEHYTHKIAEKLGVSQEALKTKLIAPKAVLKRPKAQAKPEEINKADIEANKTQDHFLALMLLQPKLRDFLDSVTEGMLYSLAAQQLLQFLRENIEFAGDVTTAMALQPISDYVKILLLQYEALYQNLELIELRYEAERLANRLIGLYVKGQKHEISEQLQVSDETETTKLLTRVKQLDSLLKQAEGGVNG